MMGRTHWIVCDACGLCIETDKERALIGYAVSQGWTVVAPDLHACPDHRREVKQLAADAAKEVTSA